MRSWTACRLFVALPLLMLASCSSTSAGDVKLDIKSFDEIQAAIKAHAGKVVVIDAWSTACEPCMREFPGLVALHKKFGADKVACISLSCDFEGVGTPEKVAPPVLAFLKEKGATFQNFLCKEDSDTLFRKLDIPSIPAMFIYGKDGALVKKIATDFSYAKDVEPVVAELVK